MTLEEALARIAALETENTGLKTKAKAADDAAATVKDLEGQVERLKSKNTELIGEKRDLQDKMKASEGGDAKALRERIEAEFKTQISELRERLDKTDSERTKIAIDAAITEALEKVQVAAPLKTAAGALLRAQRKIELANGSVLVDGKPIADAVADWAKSDEGKSFVVAPANGGSAAPGGAGGSVAKRKSEMTAAEKGEYVRKHGSAAYAALAS